MRDRHPPSFRAFLRPFMEMARMIALPIASIVVLLTMLVWWPGAVIGLPALLVLAWLCHRYANQIGSEHRG